MGAVEPQKAMANVPVCQVDELPTADAIIFGTPTTVRQPVRTDAPIP